MLRRDTALFLASFRHAINARAEVVARSLFYLILLVIFAQLWKVTFELESARFDDSFSANNFLWYLAVTEWVILSIPDVYVKIAQEIDSGDVVYSLSRPIHYLRYQLARGLGELAARMLALAVVGLGFGTMLAGPPPLEFEFLLIVPTAVVAATLGVIFQIAIGLSATWVRDVSPVYWVWQKLMFLFGGLILPIAIYPDWLQRIAVWTPFEPMLYGTGRWLIEFSWGSWAASVARLLFWLGLVLASTVWIERRAWRSLSVSGG